MDSVSTAHISVPQSINPRLQTCIDREHLLSQLFPKTGCSCILFIINRLGARSDSYGVCTVAELNAKFTCHLRARQRLLIQARWGTRLSAPSHAAEGRDALFQRRMRAEEAREDPSSRKRLHDEQRGGRWRDVHGNAFIIGAKFFESAYKSVGMPDHTRAGFVGGILALAR